MQPQVPSLETCELADTIREMLRDSLDEDARLFYGDDAVGFVKVFRRPGNRGFGLQIEVTVIGGTWMWAGSEDELIKMFGVLLESGYAERLLQREDAA